MIVNESAIAQAIQDYQSGVYTSLRATTTAYGILRSMLQRRVKGTPTVRAGYQHPQKLTLPQEVFLADWIFEEVQRGYTLSHARSREIVAKILRLNGDTTQLSKR